jgi:hypothetical protein
MHSYTQFSWLAGFIGSFAASVVISATAGLWVGLLIYFVLCLIFCRGMIWAMPSAGVLE